MTKKIYCQGDVTLKECGNIPKGAKEIPLTEGFHVLAYGEISGHAHLLEKEGVDYFEHEGIQYLKIQDNAILKHQKLDGSAAVHAHKPITLPKGNYQIGIVKEFDYFTGQSRMVAD